MITKKNILIFLVVFLVWLVLFVLLTKTFSHQNNYATEQNVEAVCLPYEKTVTSTTTDNIITENIETYNLLCWCQTNNTMKRVENFEFKSNIRHSDVCNKQCAKLCEDQTNLIGKCIKISDADPISEIDFYAQPFKFVLGCKCKDSLIDDFNYKSNTVTDSKCDNECNTICKELINE